MEKRNIFIVLWIAQLTFLSGFLNGGSLLLYSNALSHHTGNLTRAAAALSRADFYAAAGLLLLPVSFFAGAFLSGLLFHEKNFALSKRYGILLMSFSLVFATVRLFTFPLGLTCAIICVILGIQNGMFIFYKGILIRTTHLSGYLTDAALCLGGALRNKTATGKKKSVDIPRPDTENTAPIKRVPFYLFNIVCFMSGAACSVHTRIYSFFLTAALLYFVCGLYYFVLRICTLPPKRRT